MSPARPPEGRIPSRRDGAQRQGCTSEIDARQGVRRGHHRFRRGGRCRGVAARRERRARADSRARAGVAARAAKLGCGIGVRRPALSQQRNMDERRAALSARPVLLRRWPHQVLRRGDVPFSRARFRRARARRRHLAGMADQVRRPRALLRRGRAPVRRSRHGGPRSDRAAAQRAVSARRHSARAGDCRGGRALQGAGAASVPDARGGRLRTGRTLPALRHLRRVCVPRRRQGRRRDVSGAPGVAAAECRVAQ